MKAGKASQDQTLTLVCRSEKFYNNGLFQEWNHPEEIEKKGEITETKIDDVIDPNLP
jgi:hypothetical protein